MAKVGVVEFKVKLLAHDRPRKTSFDGFLLDRGSGFDGDEILFPRPIFLELLSGLIGKKVIGERAMTDNVDLTEQVSDWPLGFKMWVDGQIANKPLRITLG